jgi:PPM family protein phosphatase
VDRKFRWGAASVTNKRDNNEDQFHIDPEGNLFLVADGMGGQAAGEKASEIAAEFIPKHLSHLIDFKTDTPEAIQRAIDESVRHANSEILSLSAIDVNFHNMGTTVVLMVSVGDQLFVTGVGDSRVYQLSDGTLTQLTEDHTLTQALIKAGTITEKDAETHRFKNVLHRYLGSKEGGGPTDVTVLKIKPGDRYMLCSDGVNEGAKDPVIADVLSRCDDPQVAADEMVKASQAGGANDNITCVIVYID